MRYLLANKISFFLFVLSWVACTRVNNTKNGGFETDYLCNAEKLDEANRNFPEASGKSQTFGNIETRTREEAFSGDYSIKLTPTKPYGFSTDLEHVGPDEYIRVTAWRKNNDNGVIVIDGGEGFYNAGKYVIGENKNGWQQIFLEVYTPPNFFKGKVKIFVWDNSPDSVYFDDMEIVHRDRKIYPEYNQANALQMYIEDGDFQKLNKKRLTAFETTVLVNTDEDYSNVMLFDGNNFLNAKYRLKGDLLDHLQGDKWSFRMKLKKGFAWKHLRTFSVQNPFTRNFLYEWLAHKIYEQEDVLTTRYGFVPLRINDRSLGIYAWEEHFEKQLVESRERREGPIVRFDESILWQRVLETKVTGREWDIDYFNAAPIIPFKQGQITSDSMMTKELVESQKLMLQYKNRIQPASRIFDVDKLAQYYALVDFTQAYHGFTWHNQRFYYNPVTCLLEPIAFDGYIEGGVYKRFDEPVSGMVDPAKIQSFNKEELMLFQVFADSLFNRNYVNYLQQYSTPEFVENIVSTYKNEADSLAQVIRKEFPYYQFDFEYLAKQAKWIRENISKIRANTQKLGEAVAAINPEKFRKEYTTNVNPNLIPLMVHAYYDQDKKQIEVLSFHNDNVKLLGAFMSDRLPESFDPAPVLEPFKGVQPSQISIPVEGVPAKILFSIKNVMYETQVYPWKYSADLTTRQTTEMETTANLPLVDGKVVFDGDYTFRSDVVIPKEATEVVFMPGTKMNLINGAGFFSFVPLRINGTAEKPVQVFSDDHTAQGFNVIQPGKKSIFHFAEFSRLGSLHKEGWQSPAAVALYEADVEMENCIFASNFNCDDALNVVRSDFYVENCRFENTFADGFDSDFCTGTVKNCTFKNNGNDAIDFSGSHINISDCKMFEISDKGISGGEHSVLTVSNCTIDKANIGVASKDLSELVLDKIVMNHTVYGLVAFVKKPEYGPAKITINNLKMKDNMIFHQIEVGSVLTLNGKKIYGKEKKLAEKLYQ